MRTRGVAARLARPLISQPRAGLPPPAQLAALHTRWHDREIDGWRDFLLARGWVRRDTFESAAGEAQDAAVALLSSALTYPLTLAHALRELPERLCVIGARAERTLPASVWSELCVLTPCTARCTIELTGLTEVPPATPQERHLREPALSLLQPRGGTLFHDSDLGRALLSQDDPANFADTTFVLYNPGLGEPGWQRAWASTVRAVARSGRPIVLTGLSSHDAERDRAFWRETLDEGDALFIPAFWWHAVTSVPNPADCSNVATNSFYSSTQPYPHPAYSPSQSER